LSEDVDYAERVGRHDRVEVCTKSARFNPLPVLRRRSYPRA
jgi:hypothetical protein